MAPLRAHDSAFIFCLVSKGILSQRLPCSGNRKSSFFFPLCVCVQACVYVRGMFVYSISLCNMQYILYLSIVKTFVEEIA